MSYLSGKIFSKGVFKLISGFFLLFILESKAQTEFFNSKINYAERHLYEFYSSIATDSSQVYFISNDYNVYAYDKKTGGKKWSHYAGQKSNTSPSPHQNYVFINTRNGCEQINSKTGETIKSLEFQSMGSQPFFKNEIMYCTGVASGGSIIAYDLKNNKILWEKFISHGCETQPYYLKDKIIANAEGDNWIELDYKGKLIRTKECENTFPVSEKENACLKTFKYLSHNQKVIDEFIYLGYDTKIKHFADQTIVLNKTKLLFINNKNEVVQDIDITNRIPVEKEPNSYMEILKVSYDTVWYINENLLFVYDFKNDVMQETFDLTKWRVHQAILDGSNLWLISKNDGQLYGLKLD